MMPKPNIYLLLILFGLLGFFAWWTEQSTLANKVLLDVRPDPQDERTILLAWRSDIHYPMAVRIEKAFVEWRDRAERFVITLDSPGGALREGHEVIDVIEWMKKTHTVDTRVLPRANCLSMCVPIFLRGEHRYASASSRFMFHEPAAYDVFTGERANTPDFERARASQRFFDRYFVQSDMDPDWRDQLAQDWVGRDVWRTGRELVDQNANIVTVLE